jgi:SAM-dependent methyltransferase
MRNLARNIICGLGRGVGIATKEQPITNANGDLSRQGRRHLNLIHFIVANVPNATTKTVLDVGCGQGWLTERLYVAGFRKIAGCDCISENNLLKSVQSKLVYKQVDLDSDGLKDYENALFDLVIASDVFEHLENPAKMLRECARVLVPGGHIFLTIPNMSNIFQRLEFLRTGNSSRYKSERVSEAHGHITMLTPWIFESLVDRAELAIVEVGRGFVWWKNHFWLVDRQFTTLYSYVSAYHLMRKFDLEHNK